MIDTDNFRSRVFGPAAKKAGLNHRVSPMDLRHTAVSNLMAHPGTEAQSVAENTGHSPEVLWRTYTHKVEKALQRTAECLEEIIAGTAPRGGTEGK
jgi:site-specific recombinase XerD